MPTKYAKCWEQERASERRAKKGRILIRKTKMLRSKRVPSGRESRQKVPRAGQKPGKRV